MIQHITYQRMHDTTSAHGVARGGAPAVAAAALIWGTIGAAVELLYRTAPLNAATIGFLRLVIAAPALLLLSRWLAGPGFLRIRRRHLATMVLIGVAFAAYQACYFSAIPRLGVAAAVMINICSSPIFTAVLAGPVLRERLTAVVGLALVGGIAGTALLVGGVPRAASSGELILGALLALGAGLSYSIVTLGARVVAPFYHPVQPIAVAFTLGAVLLLPLALASGLVISMPPAGWLILAYLALVPTVLGYVLYFGGMRTTTATVAAIITLLEPLGSTLLAVLFLGELLEWTGTIGAALLLGSMLLLVGRRNAP